VIPILKHIVALLMSLMVLFGNISIFPTVADTGRRLIGRVLIRNRQLSFDRTGLSVSLYLRDTAARMNSPALQDEMWIRRLVEREFIDSAILYERGAFRAVGDQASFQEGAGSGFYIDDCSTLHWFYEADSDVFVDAMVNTARFPGFSVMSGMSPQSILLFDRSRKTILLLSGQPYEPPGLVQRHLAEGESNSFALMLNTLLTGGDVEPDLGELVFIARYAIGRELLRVIALIALLAAAILLLILATRFHQSGRMYLVRGVHAMAENKKKGDVIGEIDREIADIIDTEFETPPPAARKISGPAATSKIADEAIPQEGEADQPKRDDKHSLEHDGIIIKKG
jgi:hypothetical protein